MATMKKIWKYFLNFIVLYIIVSALTWLCLKAINNKEIETQENTIQNTTISQEV